MCCTNNDAYVKFVQHFCIITPYFWGTWIPSKSRETLHALLLPCTFWGWPQRKQLPNECEGKQTGQTTKEAGRRFLEKVRAKARASRGTSGDEQVEPSVGTESCQGTASFAISYSCSIWLQDNFTDKVMHKPLGIFLSLSGFCPYKVKRIINHG